MKTYRKLLLSLLLLFLFACSSKPDPEPESQIAGAKWLAAEEGGNMYDVLAYPLTEDELAYFESALPLLETAAEKHSQLWSEIAYEEDPSVVAAPGKVWSEAGLLGRDVIAANLKLTFLSEFASAEEGMEQDMRENLLWLEQRLQGDDAKPELFETADSIRMILGVISINRKAGAFAFYEENRARIDAALDRFTSIGEQ
ncbi:hypothetical protein [Pelagicoccus sp. SDUM812002]|uniref:hypothetical protein n=1 Tax=Pelagicoccus sp. SDUM812002 TaxID=3041266 RepID=UPI00280C4282|nr:hypothetical protein [Pelagicoccus sp. SDUM812002]MDQ8188208.1 hypothetical protein [Pelagicoccus sp. SDUM812002]